MLALTSFTTGGDEVGQGKEVIDTSGARLARQTASLMALLGARDNIGATEKTSKVWLGEGLGSVLKRTYERAMRWEFIDLAELKPRTAADRIIPESETQKLLVLPGFEIAQAKRKPITGVVTWVQCFGRYTAMMSLKFPGCTKGFMSHMLTVLKAYGEVEDPAWRMYDEAYREKMAATGVRDWPGMDIALYQEICGARPRRSVGCSEKGPSVVGMKRPGEPQRRPVCWQFNMGSCSYGKGCKFPHNCELCQGGHPKSRCPNAEKKPRL